MSRQSFPVVLRSSLVAIAMAVLLGSNQQAWSADAPPAKKDQATLEKEFAKMLTGAKLVGAYTSGKDGQPKKDEYSIIRVEKGPANTFRFTIEIKYQGATREAELPMPVEWAGDTPVLTLTEQTVPGYGKFTVRVMFYADQYAGTWAHGDRGGLMWGRIERATPATQPAK